MLKSCHFFWYQKHFCGFFLPDCLWQSYPSRPSWMRKQRGKYPNTSELIGKRQMTFWCTEIPDKLMGISGPAIASFPTNFWPKFFPVLAQRQPKLPLHRKSKFALRVNNPQDINSLQICNREIVYFGKIQPSSL